LLVKIAIFPKIPAFFRLQALLFYIFFIYRCMIEVCYVEKTKEKHAFATGFRSKTGRMEEETGKISGKSAGPYKQSITRSKRLPREPLRRIW
jgi:hypothetical protein